MKKKPYWMGRSLRIEFLVFIGATRGLKEQVSNAFSREPIRGVVICSQYL